MEENIKQKQLGQYFTVGNPFKSAFFQEWIKPIRKTDVILEPFAGSNNIVALIKEAGIDNKWACFDIDNTQHNVTPEYRVLQRDTISHFPSWYDYCITNPPYLAKVSASRRKLDYPDTPYADLYMVCLDLMLRNCKYVAVIIPESFITSGLFLDRLYGVISLNMKMFDDTDCPVCLALFSPKEECDCAKVYIGDEYLGTLCELSENSLDDYYSYYTKWKFNDKEGEIGIKCVDNSNGDDIRFFDGSLIDPSTIKVSSRSFSRISGLPRRVDRDEFFSVCNDIIKEYRRNTRDVLMTSFKGLRKDRKYRRRIDFKTVRCIMNKALARMQRTLFDYV